MSKSQFQPWRALASQLLSSAGRRAWQAELTRLPRLSAQGLGALWASRYAPDLSLWRAVSRHAKARPDQLALIDEGGSVTWLELQERAQQRAKKLRHSGVVRGQVVGLPGPTNVRWVVEALAVHALGATLRPEAAGTLPDLVAQSAGGADEGPHWVPVKGSELFALLETSGTGGRPKRARVLVGRIHLSGQVMGLGLLRLTPQDRVYCSLPLNHATGLVLGLVPSLRAGATLIIRSKFHASTMLGELRDTKATVLVYTGELLSRALAQFSGDQAVSTHLRTAIGNGLPVREWTQLCALWPGLELLEFYGATEAPGLMLNLPASPGKLGRVPFRAWSRWRVAQVTESGELCRDQFGRGTSCAPHQIGELLVRVPQATRRYAGQFEGYETPDADEQRLARNVFRPGDAYFRTGDLVSYDELDYFNWHDRLDDCVRQAGERVDARALERTLMTLGRCQELAVTGMPVAGRSGRPPLVLLVPAADFDLLDWFELVRRLPAAQRPRYIGLVSHLPRGVTGRIRAGELRRRFTEHSSEIHWYELAEAGPISLTVADRQRILTAVVAL